MQRILTIIGARPQFVGMRVVSKARQAPVDVQEPAAWCLQWRVNGVAQCGVGKTYERIVTHLQQGAVG
ncbi:hypothetical protein P8631_07675 [Guyparkeria sp. 1SP6A2]|nr:hypothetical protein [Guyparkeria sp. 1SP6A2]